MSYKRTSRHTRNQPSKDVHETELEVDKFIQEQITEILPELGQCPAFNPFSKPFRYNCFYEMLQSSDRKNWEKRPNNIELIKRRWDYRNSMIKSTYLVNDKYKAIIKLMSDTTPIDAWLNSKLFFRDITDDIYRISKYDKFVEEHPKAIIDGEENSDEFRSIHIIFIETFKILLCSYIYNYKNVYIGAIDSESLSVNVPLIWMPDENGNKKLFGEFNDCNQLYIRIAPNENDPTRAEISRSTTEIIFQLLLIFDIHYAQINILELQDENGIRRLICSSVRIFTYINPNEITKHLAFTKSPLKERTFTYIGEKGTVEIMDDALMVPEFCKKYRGNKQFGKGAGHYRQKNADRQRN